MIEIAVGAVGALLVLALGMFLGSRVKADTRPQGTREALTQVEEADEMAKDLVPDGLVGPGDDDYVAGHLERSEQANLGGAENLDAAIDASLQDLLSE